jgi:hypothetical protein
MERDEGTVPLLERERTWKGGGGGEKRELML